MNPIGHLNEIEQMICNKADLAKIPIAGNIELLPLCNMDCKMCFAKMTKAQMEAHAPMHTWEEWLEIARQSAQAGTIFMLLTGGEPFIFPNLKELYFGMKKLGLIISINTNGTLINEEIADWLSEDPPRRLNITLYGASDETYEKLCGNPKGFTQVMHAIKILKERNIDIKFNCSLTPYNIHDLDAMYQISQELDIPIEIGHYMFPPVRENNVGNEKYRLSAVAAAAARYHVDELRYGQDFDYYVANALERYEAYEQDKPLEKGYTCRAGNSVYWINYDGTMSACSFNTDYRGNVFQYGLQETWNQVKAHVQASQMAEECHFCKKRILCGRCASAAISETGDIGRIPTYYCDLTEEYIRLLYERRGNIENED